MNDEQQNYLDSVNRAIRVSDDPTQQADAIIELPTPKTTNFDINAQELVEFIEEFKFDWDNFDVEDGSSKFASESMQKMSQIINDTEKGNQYHRTFKAELAYSKLVDDKYAYKIITQSMSSKTIEEAKTEKDEIRHNISKTHPDEPDFTLEDVRVKVDIIDQNGNIIIKDKSVLS